MAAYWFSTVLIAVSSLLLMRILITTIHEMGHAIAAYMYTGERVVLYLGSYGDDARSIPVSIGKFEFRVFKNIFMWKGGLCRHSQCASADQEFMVILAGPMASLVLFISALLAFFLVMHHDDLAAGLLCVFAIWTGLSFLSNMVPRNSNIDMHHGAITYNDGTHIKRMLDAKKMPAGFDEAMDQFREKRYAECLPVFEAIIVGGTKNPEVYRNAVSANLKLKNYRRADEIQRELVSKIGNINAHDRMQMALLKGLLGKYDEAIKYYTHLLQTGGANKYNLNNFGYILSLINRHQDAITYLDKAIEIDKNFAYAYCNRAFAKLMLGWLADGKADNDRSLELNSDNAYAYRNSGIYLFESGKYEAALVQFNRANELETGLPLVDDYIWRTNQQIGTS